MRPLCFAWGTPLSTPVPPLINQGLLSKSNFSNLAHRRIIPPSKFAGGKRMRLSRFLLCAAISLGLLPAAVAKDKDHDKGKDHRESVRDRDHDRDRGHDRDRD